MTSRSTDELEQNWSELERSKSLDGPLSAPVLRQRRIEALGLNALDNPDLLMPPASVAASYWQLYQTAEKRLDVRAGNPALWREVVG
jgi:hypothetical protein